MGKYVCGFLAGIIFGIMVTGIITLTILDNGMDKLQPSLEQLNNEILSSARAVKDIGTVAKDATTATGNARDIAGDIIQLIRDEVNSYNKVDTD